MTTQTYYVAANGSDTASGSITSPRQTVDRVNRQVLNPGDTVLFRAGDTFADAVLMPPSSGTPGKPVTYSVYGKGRATITRGEWSHASCVALRTLQFSAQVQAGTDGGVQVSDWSIVNVQILPAQGNQTLGLNYNGDRLTLQQSTIRGTGLSGILMIGDTATITQNTIDNVGLYNIGYNAHGIYLDASNRTVDSNTIVAPKNKVAGCRDMNLGKTSGSTRSPDLPATGSTQDRDRERPVTPEDAGDVPRRGGVSPRETCRKFRVAP